MTVALVAAGALVIVGVAIGVLSQQDKATTSTPGVRLQDLAASQAALPLCADLFKPGTAIDGDKVAAGCRTAHGDLMSVPSFRCVDGKRLWQVDADVVGTAGYGRDGEPFTVQAAPNAGTDPGYKVAYHACRGTSAD